MTTDYDTDMDVDEEFETGEPIGDLERAEYVLTRYLYWQGRRDEVQKAHAAQTERLNARQQRLDDWAQEEDRRLEHEQAWYAAQLEAFHRAVLARDEKQKTIPLPSGKLASVMGQPKVEIVDKDAFLAKAPAEFKRVNVTTTTNPALVEIKKHIADTGEQLPGVKFIPATRKFEVKPS